MKKLVKVVTVIGVLFATMILLTGCGSKPYKKVLDKYYKAQEKADSKMIVSIFPDFMEAEDVFDDDAMEDRLDSLKDKYGDNVKIKYKIDDSEKLDKDEIEELEEHIEDTYGEDVKVQEAYKVKVEATYKGSEDSDTEDEEFGFVKIKGKWYMYF